MAVERTWQIGADNGGNLAGLKEVAQRSAGLVRGDLSRLEERHQRRMAVTSRLVDSALHPFNAGQVNPKVVLHRAASKEGCSLRVKRNADTLAGKVLGRAHEPAVHHDKAMAKYPGGEDRQRDKRQFIRRK